MKRIEYVEGPDAGKNFDEGMTRLFRAPKTTITLRKSAPKPEKEKLSKD